MKHRKLFPIPETANNTLPCTYICDPGCPYNYMCEPSPNIYFPPTTPPPPPPMHHKHSVSPYVVIFVSFAACFFLFVWVCVIITKIRARENNRTQEGQQNGADEEFLDENRVDHPIWLIATVGLQQSVISAISVCKYKKGEGLIEGTECSVCLNEFQDDEMVRLLPKCNHAFHVSCIDTWLRSHINCPMCRAYIVSPETVTAAPLASMDQNWATSNLAEATNVENSEIGRESGEDQERNCEVNENRTGREESEIAQVGSDTILKDSVSFNRNADSQVVDGNEIQVVANDIQSLGRSTSLDSSLAETICLGLADFCGAESGDCLFDETKDADKSHLAALLKQCDAYSRWSRLTGSSSIGQCLHKGPVSMKRSFSCSGRFFSSRRNRSLNAILPL